MSSCRPYEDDDPDKGNGRYEKEVKMCTEWGNGDQ